jgi:hypothetical protein
LDPHEIFGEKLFTLLKTHADAASVHWSAFVTGFFPMVSLLMGWSSLQVKDDADWFLPIKLDTILVMESGDGKSPVLNLVKKLMDSTIDKVKKHLADEQKNSNDDVDTQETGTLQGVHPSQPYEYIRCGFFFSFFFFFPLNL